MASRMVSRCASSENYEDLHPEIVVPDYFFTGNESTIVAIYNEPLKDVQTITLEFPGDVTGNSITPPKLVEPRRVGSQTIVFKTPVYESANRGVVEIRPMINLTTGERINLPTFKILLKHPIRSVMELCMNLSTNEAVLPVLISLMVHCQTDSSTSEDHFKDPHIDRIMATLVGSRSPQSSNAIEDIILPSKKWRRMTLGDFAREFKLPSMEKQAYELRKRHAKQQQSRTIPTRSFAHSTTMEGFTTSNLEIQQSHSDMDIHKAVNDEESHDEIQRLIRKAKSLCKVTKDYKPKHPNDLPLGVNQMVYVVTKDEDRDTVPIGKWYGVCEGKSGYFPSKCVRCVRQIKRERSHSTVDITDTNYNDFERSSTLRGQNITSDELKHPPRHQYANIDISPRLYDNSQRNSPQIRPRFRVSDCFSETQSDSDVPLHDTVMNTREKMVKQPIPLHIPAPHHVAQTTSCSPTGLKYPSPDHEAILDASKHSRVTRKYTDNYDDNTDYSDSSDVAQLPYTEDEDHGNEDLELHNHNAHTCSRKIVPEALAQEVVKVSLKKKIPPNPPPRMPKKALLITKQQESPLQTENHPMPSHNRSNKLKKKPLPIPPKKINKPVPCKTAPTEDLSDSDGSDYEEVNVGVSPSCNVAVHYMNCSEIEVVEDHLYDLPQLPEEVSKLVHVNQRQQSNPQSEDQYHDIEPPSHHLPSVPSKHVSILSRRQNVVQQLPPRNVYRDEARGIQHMHNRKTFGTEISVPLSNNTERKAAKKPIPPPKNFPAKGVQRESDKHEQAFSKHQGIPTPFIRTHL